MKNECREYAEMIRNDVNSLYDGETVDECESLWDYVADALDVEYTLNSSRELIGVRVYVTIGGPKSLLVLHRKYARKLTPTLKSF